MFSLFFLWFPLLCKKLLSLITSYLFIFAYFYFFALGDWSKKIVLWFLSKNVLPMFSSKSFMVLYLIFKSLNRLSLLLYMVWESVLTSLIYMRLSSFPNTACWRDCLFSIVYSFLLCCRLIDHRCCGITSRLSILFHWSICLFLCW